MSPSDDQEKTEARVPLDVAQSYPCLEVISGPMGVGRYPLQKGKTTLGRSRDNDVVLDDSSVSRRHAVLEVAENGATIADMGSRNGTKVNGQKIKQTVSLSQDARIKIGVYQLRFLTGPVKEEEEEEPLPLAEEGDSAFKSPKAEVLDQPPETEIDQSPSTPIPVGSDESPLPAERPPAPLVKGFAPALKKLPKKQILLYGLLGVLVVVLISVFVPKLFKKAPGKKEITKKMMEKIGEVGGVIPVETAPATSAESEAQPIFLEFTTTPIPSRVYFGEENVGVTPLRVSSKLQAGKWYEAKAVFQLPEVGEVVEEKVQFSPPAGAGVLPVAISGKIGVFKIAMLPRNSQLYLEGYFSKEPFRAKPIKFSEIVFGKPIYVPYGRYILELRKTRQLGSSQTYLDEVVYRREFQINEQQTSFTVDVNDDQLKTFPVQLTSVPPGAKVFIDEKEVGVTPFDGTFPVGEHVLLMKREGYFDYVQVIRMEINTPYTAEIQLKTSAAGELVNKADALLKEARFSEALPVLIEALSKSPSELETAQISYLIGVSYLKQKQYKEAQDYFEKAMLRPEYKYHGRLGVASVLFEQGDGAKALQNLVEVLVASEDPKVRADAGQLFQKISPLKSVMYVTSDPTGARVFVNGMEIQQQTPMILHDLSVGSYRIQFRKDGYADEEIKLNVGVSEFRPVVVKLKKSG